MGTRAKEYVRFRLAKDTGKTQIWEVYNTGGLYLGDIKWYGPWRQYIFSPTEWSFFSVGCMRTIINKMEDLRIAKNQRRLSRLAQEER